jgi:hypothetical protein
MSLVANDNRANSLVTNVQLVGDVVGSGVESGLPGSAGRDFGPGPVIFDMMFGSRVSDFGSGAGSRPCAIGSRFSGTAWVIFATQVSEKRGPLGFVGLGWTFRLKFLEGRGYPGKSDQKI